MHQPGWKTGRLSRNTNLNQNNRITQYTLSTQLLWLPALRRFSAPQPCGGGQLHRCHLSSLEHPAGPQMKNRWQDGRRCEKWMIVSYLFNQIESFGRTFNALSPYSSFRTPQKWPDRDVFLTDFSSPSSELCIPPPHASALRWEQEPCINGKNPDTLPM